MNKLDNMLFEFAYRMALDDATGQGAYKSRGKGSKAKLRECNEAKRAVKEYIDDIFDPKNQPDFEKASTKVEKAFNAYLTEEDDGTFTFGNTQKLINMTAKYMFMATYNRPQLREQFKPCHCPMDSIILQTVVDKARETVESGNASSTLQYFVDKCSYKRPRKCDWIVVDDLKWSQLEHGDERYRCFQDAVQELADREGVSPIEFDFKHWN